MPRVEELLTAAPAPSADDLTEAFWQACHGGQRRLEEALDCSFLTTEHAAILAMMLAAIDHYSAQIQGSP
jgi:hypothetical protein